MTISSLPKVLLHDHLDGGLRPSTVIELAAEAGHEPPATDPQELGAWFFQGEVGSLEAYLATFVETVAVMQNPRAICRVAYEAGLDLAADGVVYAEQRYAPALSTAAGMSLHEVIAAVLEGLRLAENETGIVLRFICDAMRQDNDSEAVVEAALRAGAAGFDLAGPEDGFPPNLHRSALDRAAASGLGVTIHAGEAAGLASIEDALQCGAQRLGHGVRIMDDCVVENGQITKMGPLAASVHARSVPLEICPTSNLHTMKITAPDHPVGLLHRAGFEVTINTDDRLMSGTSMSQEFDLLIRDQGFTVDDLAAVTRRALRAAFVDDATKAKLWAERIAPAYRVQGATLSADLNPRGLSPR